MTELDELLTSRVVSVLIDGKSLASEIVPPALSSQRTVFAPGDPLVVVTAWRRLPLPESDVLYT